MKRKSLDDLVAFAKLKKGECLSTNYLNSRTRYAWKCQKGHIWEATSKNVCGLNQWCPRCASKRGGLARRHNLIWLQKMATQRLGTCLSKKYIRSKSKYLWRCKEGHEWKARANGIKRGQWCPFCAGLAPHNVQWLNQLAKNKNGRCLSKTYINIGAKYEWECQLNHKWKSTANDISHGHWCPHCAGKAPHTIAWLKDLAKSMDGECLSERYEGMMAKYIWRCKNAHEWEAMAANIQQKHWCPECPHWKSKPELEVFDFVKNLYPESINGKRGILKNKRFEFDIWIPDLMIAIEYDGPWHDRDHVFCKQECIDRDKRKNNECCDTGVLLIRIKHKDFIYDKDAMLSHLSKCLEFRNEYIKGFIV